MPASERAILRDQLAAIVREAGELALATAKTPFKRWMKAGQSPVSDADIAVNNFLHQKLPALVRDAGWLSEETEDDFKRTAAARVWVVDPIDGTRAFLEQRPDWTISVALVEGARPAVAALYAPVTDELYLAARGEGATLNGARMKVGNAEGLAGARLAGPKSYLARMSQLNPRTLPQPKIHSLALRLTRVADGSIDIAFASRSSHDWDLAAADLLVHEAGGVLTDLSGNVLTYNRRETSHPPLVAAAPQRHAALIDLLRDHEKNSRKVGRKIAGFFVKEMLMSDAGANRQLLHLVFGGELTDVSSVEFKDLDKLDLVGMYPNYASAYAAWKAKAQQTVDNAHMRYFIVHLHRLLDPAATQSKQ